MVEAGGRGGGPTVCGAVCPGESQRAGDSLPSAGRAADGDHAAVGRAHLCAGQAEAEEEKEKEDETVATLLLLLFSVAAAFVVILAGSLSVLFVLVPLCSGSHRVSAILVEYMEDFWEMTSLRVRIRGWLVPTPLFQVLIGEVVRVLW